MKYSKGFTLIEVAIVAVIGGILIVSLSNMLMTYIKQTRYTSTERKLELIDEALQLHLSLRGRYPCAAPMNADYDTAGFGVEISNTNCNGAAAVAGETITAVGRAPRTVRIGAVPVRTLNLPDDFIGDAWGGRFTYAVTEALAEPGTYDRDEGAISIVDTNGNSLIAPNDVGETDIAHFVIISHGPNSSGAMSLSGGGAIACVAADIEGENCDGDATFVSTLITSLGANTYDDIVSVRAAPLFGQIVPERAVMAFNSTVCPSGWAPFADAEGRVIIGADSTYEFGKEGGSSEVDLTITRVTASVGGGGTDVIQDISITSPIRNNLPPYLPMLYCVKT